jgi:aspartate aminotransferase
MGYAAGPKDVITAMAKYQGQLYTNITAFVQKAVIAALNISPDVINEMKRKFKARRDMALEIAESIPGMTCVRPGGTFYLFPSVKNFFGKKSGGTTINTSEDLAKILLEEAHVAVVPGTAFGMDGYIRISFALADHEVKKGMEKIRDFLATLK